MTDLASLLQQSFANQKAAMSVAVPGKITSYSAGSQRASVQPLLSRALTKGETEDMPVLEDVPVIWPRSGGAVMTFPVKSGDGCLLIFIDRSMDEWKQNGGQVAPKDPRSHAFSDAVAIMGLVDFGSAGGSGDAVEIKMGGTTFALDGSEVTVTGPSVKIDSPDTRMTGNLTVDGDMSGSGSMIVEGSLEVLGSQLLHQGTDVGNTHKHDGVETGGSNTGEPI